MNEFKSMIDNAFNYYVGMYSMHKLKGRDYKSLLALDGMSKQALNSWLFELEDMGVIKLVKDVNNLFKDDEIVLEIIKEIPRAWLKD